MSHPEVVDLEDPRAAASSSRVAPLLPLQRVVKQKAMPKRRRTEELIDVEAIYDRWARESAAGRLLLGPLPTATNEDQFGSVSMQVSCMGKDPQQRSGLVLQGAHLFPFEIVNSRARESQFQAIFAVVQHSLRAGGSLPLHGGAPQSRRGQTRRWPLLRPTCTWRPRMMSRCVRTSRRGTRPGVSGARSWLRTSMEPSLGSDPSVQRASILLLPPFSSNMKTLINVVAPALRAL